MFSNTQQTRHKRTTDVTRTDHAKTKTRNTHAISTGTPKREKRTSPHNELLVAHGAPTLFAQAVSLLACSPTQSCLCFEGLVQHNNH